MKRIGIVLLVALSGCSRSRHPSATAGRPSAPRLLELSAFYSFPPGSYDGYTLREVDGRIEGYGYDLRDSTKHYPMELDPRFARFIDRVDSLITYRLPSDTNRALAPGQREICGDAASLGARLTIGTTVRTVGVGTCEDRSPGAGRRLAVLGGIADSLARATRRQ
jgi:hypothetical protein